MRLQKLIETKEAKSRCEERKKKTRALSAAFSHWPTVKLALGTQKTKTAAKERLLY